jgi:hypothetical protein
MWGESQRPRWAGGIWIVISRWNPYPLYRKGSEIMSDGYNGYTNYETWVTSLWMDNEPHTNEYLYELANREPVHESEIAELVDKADDLEGYVRDMILSDSHHIWHDKINGLGTDLLTHAISAINWREIIESHVEIPVA